MRTRRRRAKFTWLPNLGSAQAATPSSDDDFNGIIFTQLDVASGGATSPLSGIGVVPLTFDEPHEGLSTNLQDSLADRIGSEWFLKRLVGKLFASYENLDANPVGCLYGAGFFVARATETGVNAEKFPIGGENVALQIANYNPLITDQVREPWLWRRVWCLGLGQTSTQAGDSSKGLQFPTTTAGYGSVMDGPHIDAKSVRRIRGDERLWFVHACKSFNAVSTTGGGRIDTYLDYRILGALRKARSRSAF